LSRDEEKEIVDVAVVSRIVLEEAEIDVYHKGTENGICVDPLYSGDSRYDDLLGVSHNDLLAAEAETFFDSPSLHVPVELYLPPFSSTDPFLVFHSPTAVVVPPFSSPAPPAFARQPHELRSVVP